MGCAASVSSSSTSAPPMTEPVVGGVKTCEVVGVEVVELGGQVEQVLGGQLVVEGDVLLGRADELAVHEGVAGTLGDGPLQRELDELLLAGDAPDVAGRVLLPVAVLVALEVAGPGVGQALDAVEGGAARAG